MLKRFKVNTETYNLIIEKAKKCYDIVEANDVDVSGSSAYVYFRDGKYRTLKDTVILNHITSTGKDCLIIEEATYSYYTGNNVDGINYYQQFILMDGGNEMEEILLTPWPTQANKYVHKILNKHYTDEEIENILNSHVISEEDKVKPVHRIATDDITYDFDVLYEISNVVYYDINKAHRDALIEMFPKCSRYFKDKKTMDRWGKDCINIYVGDLCNHNHRETYNWIVKRTRNLLEKVIKDCNGSVIYANTDGVMIHNPHKTIKTSNEVGEFSNEMNSDKVYFYYHLKEENIPQYYLYQYIDKHGKMTKKGTLQKDLRNNVDLAENKIWSNRSFEKRCI